MILLFCVGAGVVLVALAICIYLWLASPPKQTWPGAPYPYAPREANGYPYPLSPELEAKLKEEAERRIEIVRSGGIPALKSYLDINRNT